MPPAKGKKKKKKGKKKGKKEYLPLIYNIPDYEDPDIVTPKVNLVIKNARPPNELLTLRLEDIPISTRVDYIAKQILKMHQGAIINIKIARDRYVDNEQEQLDMNKTLEQCGIMGEGEVKLLYEYTPIMHPLLV